MGGLFLAWIVEVGIITWRDVSGKVPNHTINGLPLPADYLASFLIFGALGFAPKDNVGASRAAALTGWAFVVATYLNIAPSIVNPTNTKTAAAGTTAATGAVSQSKTEPTSSSTSSIIQQ
jgi:hypothetical protein